MLETNEQNWFELITVLFPSMDPGEQIIYTEEKLLKL